MQFLERELFLIESKIKVSNKNSEVVFLLSEMKKIGIEKLPYSYTSLKKFIDSETMNFHYNKHYKGYVDKLNKLLSNKKNNDLSLEEIIKSISKFDKKIRNNAGGAFNHALFWKMLSPTKKKIDKELITQIDKSFGSFTNFKKEFTEVAKDIFGSGWVWLVVNKQGKLKIIPLPNQDNPLMNVIEKGGYPILGLDVWEHAYYLKYKNKRDEYINNFWNFINWDFVFDLYKNTKNEKQMIKESENEKLSKSCSPQEKEQIRKLFNSNRDIVQIYRIGIDHILKNVFPNNWYEKGKYAPNSLQGIYDFETKGRSIINKLNTNYNLFCVLYRDINKVLRLEGKEPINIFGGTPSQELEKTKDFLRKVNEYKSRIFATNSTTFRTIMSTLEEKHTTGENLETYVVGKLKAHFGPQNLVKTGELGGTKDVYGVDCEIKINNVNHTGQIKPFKSFEKVEIDGEKYYKILETGYVKKYKTDFLIFGKISGPIKVFNNKRTQIIDGNFHIPTSDLILEL